MEVNNQLNDAPGLTPKERRLAAMQQEAGWVPKLVWMWWWGEKYQPPTTANRN